MTTSTVIIGLAPMAGFTDWPMRVISCNHGANYVCTEMVSAMGLMCAKESNSTYQQLVAVHEGEHNTACQLFGRDPIVMGEAAQRITALNRFTSIDINMGCPARKIVSNGDGSALLKTPELAYRIMESVKLNTTLPVTLKTRLGYDAEHMNAIELAKAAESLSFKWVCFHGRTREQQYSGVADHHAIAELRTQLNIPVLANGDVYSAEDALRILAITGASGLLIGRGAMGNPWLFGQIKQALAGEVASVVSSEERLNTAITHLRFMIDYKGEQRGIIEMRKHLSHYIAGFRGATALRRQINQADTSESLLAILQEACS